MTNFLSLLTGLPAAIVAGAWLCNLRGLLEVMQ